MKPVVLWKVAISTRGSIQWVGSFLEKPTRDAVVAAIQCVIDTTKLEAEKACGYSREDCYDYLELLEIVQQIVPHAPADFAATQVKKNVVVADTTIGTIQVFKGSVYIK